MNKVVLKSPAKINVGLRITGRRQNEYHELQSLFVPVEFWDELILEEGVNSLPDDNTVSKTLGLLKKDYKVTLNKRIPIGAGLGGGSSNAGTLLTHFKKEYSLDKLNQMALKIGADVPFFIEPKTRWVEGIGEKMTPVTLPHPLHICLILFPFQCLTKDVFKAYKDSSKKFSHKIAYTHFEEYLTHAVNDLEETVCKLYPAIGQALADFRKLPSLHCGMSGSGSTCYLLFKQEAQIKKYTKVISELCRMYDCDTVWVKSFSDKT